MFPEYCHFSCQSFLSGGGGVMPRDAPSWLLFPTTGILLLLWKAQFMSYVVIRKQNGLLCISKPLRLLIVSMDTVHKQGCSDALTIKTNFFQLSLCSYL